MQQISSLKFDATALAASKDSITILLVDDNPSVRALVQDTLRSSSYRVLNAVNSDDALRVSDEYPGHIHLLISDLVMPPFMSGNELATCIRFTRPDIKVLYISGYSANDGVTDEVGDGEADFLPKPFPPELLLEKVRRLAATKASRPDRAQPI